ncbi:hypothetical protein OG736_43780 [Streptomyces sp. NBC_01334]|nr:hypothetical protein OG736_43780 [Streptomyces sp. NBC_01334]
MSLVHAVVVVGRVLECEGPVEGAGDEGECSVVVFAQAGVLDAAAAPASGAEAVAVGELRKERPASACRDRHPVVVAVGFAVDQVVYLLAVLEAGASPEPVVRLAHDQGRGFGQDAVVLHAQQPLFGTAVLLAVRVVLQVAPAVGGTVFVRCGILGLLVADDGAGNPCRGRRLAGRESARAPFGPHSETISKAASCRTAVAGASQLGWIRRVQSA